MVESSAVVVLVGDSADGSDRPEGRARVQWNQLRPGPRPRRRHRRRLL